MKGSTPEQKMDVLRDLLRDLGGLGAALELDPQLWLQAPDEPKVLKAWEQVETGDPRQIYRRYRVASQQMQVLRIDDQARGQGIRGLWRIWFLGEWLTDETAPPTLGGQPEQTWATLEDAMSAADTLACEDGWRLL